MTLPSIGPKKINYEEKVKVHIFSKLESKRSSDPSFSPCPHFFYLVKDGWNHSSSGSSQRYKCKNCGKRFGSNTNEWNMLVYKAKINRILHSIFFEGTKEISIGDTWEIPQYEVSRFKHKYVDQVFEQHPTLINQQEYAIPKGVIYGDETFFGKRGNSLSEIVFVNDKFEVIAAGLVEPKNLEKSIKKIFLIIPKNCRDKLRVLVSDGEPSYKSIPFLGSLRSIVVQQNHTPGKLGKISIHKYEKFGPHHLHYIIYTHWKIFTKARIEISVKWEIKFIKTKLPIGRGGLTLEVKDTPLYQQWRQKKEEYYSESFRKHGTAKLSLNPDSRKISLMQGSKSWMKKMIEPLFPIFSQKCVTNNRVESKHSQLKRTGRLRKQQQAEYADKLFQLQEYIMKTGHLPETYLEGKPLYKFLIPNDKRRVEGYPLIQNEKKMVQTIIPAYLG
ncbi:MAG: hypothetical protein EU530_11120 [Promethearchaeota archaeon]|nr:MAG: hypothetical protein EU530_11120 [Candidatus Lokiarchaeota archaeon]